MAKKSSKENLSDLSLEQLQDQVADSKLQLKKMKFTHSIQPIENPMEIRLAKRKVARLMTELSKRKNETAS